MVRHGRRADAVTRRRPGARRARAANASLCVRSRPRLRRVSSPNRHRRRPPAQRSPANLHGRRGRHCHRASTIIIPHPTLIALFVRVAADIGGRYTRCEM